MYMYMYACTYDNIAYAKSSSKEVLIPYINIHGVFNIVTCIHKLHIVCYENSHNADNIIALN